ncbi:nuclease domain-containing protein [Vibrio lentus]|uniref:EstP n=1 Tax=Vibrio lentus TaxID=136468 RepID=A0A4U2EG69_9VIBR|nr:nuclease domain-containing protein [Vibrio lentus]TKG01203.1 EstP [Vibrio lentus]
MMLPKFEIKYIDVQWHDKNTVLKVVESYLPLPVSYDDTQKNFNCTTTIYPKAEGIRLGQLAFRYLDGGTTAPYFEKADGARVQLKKIKDKDSGKSWWIEAVSWKSDTKQWTRTLHRTAGAVKAGLGSQSCTIHIGSSEFTAEQLNRYLSDFKSDLWELILDEQSYVTAKAKKVEEGGVDEETLKLVSNLMSHAQNIIKKPKSELREVQALKPRNLVKPVNRTFMELATKGYSKELTSRATTPSFNVPENRYVLFVLQRLHSILKQLVTISQSKINRFEGMTMKLTERLNDFSGEKSINKDLVRKHLEQIKKTYDLEYLNSQLQEKFQACIESRVFNRPQYKWQIRIRGASFTSNRYFLDIRTDNESEWFSTQRKQRQVFIHFNDDSYADLFEKDIEYEITADIFQPSIQGTKYIYTLNELYSVKVLDDEGLNNRRDKFSEELKKALELDKRDWVKKLTPKELAEQEREKRSVQTQLTYFQQNKAKVELVFEQLEPKLAKFKSAIRMLEKIGVRPSPTFPNSMTFVQNPDYQAMHSGYKKVRELTNLTDEDLLLSLEKVENIGLVNMPLLYERWCLLQIIKVLVQNYRYQPDDEWKRQLLNIVLSHKHSKPLNFNNEQLKRKVQLRYEPLLNNGRTPDFVMDVEFETKGGITKNKRLVMDAKFYSDEIINMHGGIAGIVHNLYHKKDYSEGGVNAVFILHPAKGAIDEIVSPQEWGEVSYLGELSMFDWDKMPRHLYHQYGAVCANPVLRLRYLDEIQRMIGMFLQYGIEDNALMGRPDDVESINFCISCGSHELTKRDTTTSNSRSAWYECDTCKHFTVYNHCHSCDTRLVKNGDYWSYHSQMAMEPLNIKCPSCESLV